MITRLHKEIEKLKNQLLRISTLAEESVHKSIEALEKRDVQLANEIIQRDKQIDTLEVELEEDCLKILALHQPVAIDLRFIVAMLKINSDIERIGDLGADIAKQIYILADHNSELAPFDLKDMATYSWKMVRNSLDALVNMDKQLAEKVILDDETIDNMHDRNCEKIRNMIDDGTPDTKESISYLSISRYLERIADHATNIAEDVIYMLEGNIIRHPNRNK